MGGHIIIIYFVVFIIYSKSDKVIFHLNQTSKLNSFGLAMVGLVGC